MTGKKIMGVLGPISPDQLGATLVHEHFVYGYSGWYADDTVAPNDPGEVMKTCLDSIQKARNGGIGTIIDATPNDGGRDPGLYKALAEKSGMNIICSTGLYTEHHGSPAYWLVRGERWRTDYSKMMAEMFIREITEGISRTGVKPGVLKIATSLQMSKYEEAVHRAAAVAQKETGIPIITHTEGPTGGIEQADFLLSEGADPKKVMIGHVSNSKDIEYHKSILERGVYIAFDRIGLGIVTPTDIIVQNISGLCGLGFADRIMLSHDTVQVTLGRPIEVPERFQPRFADWQIDHISRNALAALKAQGVTDEQIKTMMVENPRNLFLGK